VTKVLFLYKYLTLGGVEAVLRARLEGLPRRKVDAHAWFLNDCGGGSMFAGSEDRFRIGPVADCMRHFARHQFDVLCTIDTPEVFFGFAGYCGPGKLVVEAHTAYPENLAYLSGLAAVSPAAVFAPSRFHAGLVRSLVGDKIPIRLVPNPLHASFLAPPGAGERPRRPILGWVGRVEDLKNWRDLLDACALLSQRGHDFEICVVGRPIPQAEAPRFVETARGLGLLGRLRWLRGIPHHHMPAFFDLVRSSGGVAVTTSRAESFGMTVAEAMARGCAVIVPDGGVFGELVDDGVDGFHYRRGATESLAARLATLLADGELRRRCGESARAKVVRQFSPERVLPLLADELAAVASDDFTVALGAPRPA
jgi:glycosyltransferase involved in cell wall biosynthesis